MKFLAMKFFSGFWRNFYSGISGGFLVCLSAGFLVACSSDGINAVKCPSILIPEGTERLIRFHDGQGRDITDVLYAAKLTFLSGSCVVSENRVSGEIPVAVQVERGPAYKGEEVVPGVIMALVNADGRIISRREFDFRGYFEQGVIATTLQDTMSFDFRKDHGETAQHYTIYLSFALSREELRFNRSDRKN